MCLGAKIDFSVLKKRFDKILFSENGIVIQAKEMLKWNQIKRK
jgi:hypothetical protein